MVRGIFLHLPKTAGTSFREALSLGFGPEAVSPAFAASRLSAEDAEELSRYQIVSGHISIADVDLFFPNAKIFTVLREPIERCLSWYHFVRNIVDYSREIDVIAAKNKDIDANSSSDPQVLFRNMFNRQVRQLGDHVLNLEVDMEAAYARALLTVRRCVWVGRQKTLAADMVRLVKVFPQMAGIEVPSLNVTPGMPPAGDQGAELRTRIASQNVYDLRLYASSSEAGSAEV